MSRFEIIEAKPFHCGAMVRRMRTEHAYAIERTGLSAHRELRAVFDQSAFRRALLVDGELAGLGGVVGAAMASTGFAWLVISDIAARHPHAMVRIVRQQLAEIMTVKRELAITIVGGDAAAMRLAVFLGFHVEDDGPGAPAFSRQSRQSLRRYLETNADLRLPSGTGHVIAMGYHDQEAA